MGLISQEEMNQLAAEEMFAARDKETIEDFFRYASNLGYTREHLVGGATAGDIAVPDQQDLAPNLFKEWILHRGRDNRTYPNATGLLLPRYQEGIVTPPNTALEKSRYDGKTPPRGDRMSVYNIPDGTLMFDARNKVHVIKRVADGGFLKDKDGNYMAKDGTKLMEKDFNDMGVEERLEKVRKKPRLWREKSSAERVANGGYDDRTYVHYWETYVPRHSHEMNQLGIVSDMDIKAHNKRYGDIRYDTKKLQDFQNEVKNISTDDLEKDYKMLQEINAATSDREKFELKEKYKDQFKLFRANDKIVDPHIDAKDPEATRKYMNKHQLAHDGNFSVVWETNDLVRVAAETSANKKEDGTGGIKDDGVAVNDAFVFQFDRDGRFVKIRERLHEIDKGSTMAPDGQSLLKGPTFAFGQMGFKVWSIDEETKEVKAKNWLYKHSLPVRPSERYPIPFRATDSRRPDFLLDPNRPDFKQNFETQFKWLEQRDPNGDFINSFSPEERKQIVDEMKFEWGALWRMDPDPVKNIDALEVKMLEKIKKYWDSPKNAKRSLIHYGSLTWDGEPPLSVDKEGLLTPVYRGKDIREYHASSGIELYYHSTGEKTMSPLGGLNHTGGNLPAYGKWHENYFFDKYVYDFYEEFTPVGLWHAKDRAPQKATPFMSKVVDAVATIAKPFGGGTTPGEELSSFSNILNALKYAWTDQSKDPKKNKHYDLSNVLPDKKYEFHHSRYDKDAWPMETKAQNITKYIYKNEIGSTPSEDALPRAAGAGAMAIAHREMSVGWKNFTTGVGIVAKHAAKGALFAGIGLGISAGLGFSVFAAMGAAAGGAALAAGIGTGAVAGIGSIVGSYMFSKSEMQREYTDFAEKRLTADIHPMERAGNFPIYRLYREREYRKEGQMMQSIKEDFNLFRRGMRSVLFTEVENRENLSDMLDDARRNRNYGLVSVGAAVAGGIGLGIAASTAVITAPAVIAGAAVAGLLGTWGAGKVAVGSTQAFLQREADLGYAHFVGDYNNRAIPFLDQNKDTYSDAGVDKYSRVKGSRFERELPAAKDYFKDLAATDSLLNDALGLRPRELRQNYFRDIIGERRKHLDERTTNFRDKVQAPGYKDRAAPKDPVQSFVENITSGQGSQRGYH